MQYNKEKISLSKVWKYVVKDYTILKYVGSGSFGTVVKA